MNPRVFRARATALAFALSLLVTPAAAQQPFSDFGQRFTQYPGNPLLTLESINPWDLDGSWFSALPGVIHPDVLYFPEGKDNYKFWMVFTPWEGWEPGVICGALPVWPPPAECPPPPWLSHVQYWERLTIVRSNDGINWEKPGVGVNPVISPSLSGASCEGSAGEIHSDPDLVYAEDRGPNGEDWFLYYNSSCGPGPGQTFPNRQVIKLALSEDGIHYTEYPGPVMPVTGGVEMPDDLAGPTVVYDPGANGGKGLFYGWYFYLPIPGGSLGFATSPDGIDWTPASGPACPTAEPCWANGVIQPEATFCESGMSHPDVIKKGDEFWIYYQAEPTHPPPYQTLYHDFMIRRAVSTDGINWTKDDRPILEKHDFEPNFDAGRTTTNPMPGQWTFWDRTGPATEPSEVTMFYRPSAVVVGNAMYLYFGGLNKTAYNDFKSDRDIGLAFSSRFDDVPPTHWAYTHVEAVAQAGVSVGCGSNNFCPGTVVTRKEAAAFVTLASDIPIPPGAYDRNFCDIPNDAFAPLINALYEEGMVEGCGLCGLTDPREQFCSDVQMNRLDLGLFFYKALGLTGPGIPYFDDVPQPYKPLIDRLHDPDVAITAGCADHLDCPTELADRATLAVFTSLAFLAP